MVGGIEAGDPTVLRYHYVEGLQADHPEVEVHPHHIAGLPEPFIELRSPEDVGHLLLLMNQGGPARLTR